MDNFNYSYYSDTNKLQRVLGAGKQFIYDNNDNVTSEALNNNSEMKYDYRNLLTQLRHRSQIITDSSYYVSYYNYDEAGNRISKKVYKYTGTQPEPPPPDIDSLDIVTDWELESDVIYSRDVTGKELAIYESDSLLQWNIWGLDNVGKIDAGGLKYFYLKDHLGSIRVIMDENPAVVFAEDYDAWGYGLEERNYAKDNSMYKFTGKERDKESEYDYFGARYYDARIGRWGTTDPLMEKHYDFSPYNYVLDNPLYYIDPDGKQVAKYIFDAIKKILINPNENDIAGFGNKDEDLDKDGIKDNFDSYDSRSDEQKFRDAIIKKSKESSKESIKSSDKEDEIEKNKNKNFKETVEEKLQKHFLEMVKELNIQKRLLEAAKNIENERSKIGIKDN